MFCMSISYSILPKWNLAFPEGLVNFRGSSFHLCIILSYDQDFMHRSQCLCLCKQFSPTPQQEKQEWISYIIILQIFKCNTWITHSLIHSLLSNNKLLSSTKYQYSQDWKTLFYPVLERKTFYFPQMRDFTWHEGLFFLKMKHSWGSREVNVRPDSIFLLSKMYWKVWNEVLATSQLNRLLKKVLITLLFCFLTFIWKNNMVTSALFCP
jgi:hypothetical protein